MECTQPTVTRRELRLAEKRAHRRRLAPARPTSSTAMALSIAICSALLGGGTSQAFSEHQVRASQQRVAAAVALAFANRVRADDAAGARLDGVAVAFATVKRSEAVGRARTAVAQAVSARASSAPDVTPETLTPLDEAMASLTAMIDAAPIAPVTASAPVPFELSETAPPDDPFALGPPDPATADDVDADDAVVDAVTDAGADDDAVAVAVADSAGTADAASADSGAPTADAMDAVDLDVSAQMLVAAQLVTDLSVQVQAVAGANVAAAAVVAAEAAEAAVQAAAAEAARVVREAERAVAAKLERKVEAADDARNGEIPAELLCAVSFDTSALLRCDAAEALERLAVAYRAEFGRNPKLASTYRSFSDQVSVRQSRGGLAAVPGSSNHGRGQAVDFANFGSLGQFSAPTYRWMTDNAGEFGWHHPAIMEPDGGGPQEPWHWEFDTD